MLVVLPRQEWTVRGRCTKHLDTSAEQSSLHCTGSWKKAISTSLNEKSSNSIQRWPRVMVMRASVLWESKRCCHLLQTDCKLENQSYYSAKVELDEGRSAETRTIEEPPKLTALLEVSCHRSRSAFRAPPAPTVCQSWGNRLCPLCLLPTR